MSLSTLRQPLLRGCRPSSRCIQAPSVQLQRWQRSFRMSAPVSSSTQGDSSSLRKTGLYDFHVENGAKMVEFAGYSMPLAYGDVGAVASHKHVRSSAGLFDVGHMVQSKFFGPSVTQFLEWLTPSSLSTLPAYSSTLSVLLNEHGGIIDDTVITKHADDAFYVVTNAGRRDRDLAWFTSKLEEWNSGKAGKAGEMGEKGKVEIEVLEDWGLVALQGPEAATILQGLTAHDLSTLTFGRAAYVSLEGGFNVHVARGGYTGEDGFEISIPPSETLDLTKLLVRGPVQLTGLGARDSLRLEAGMCLYGHDLDEETTPVEAGLSWVVGKDRRERADFIGAQGVLAHLKNGPPRRRVGLIVEGAPAREGAKIFSASSTSSSTSSSNSDDEPIGNVTSGIPSPTLGKNIAMGYVANGLHKKGTKLQVEVRGKRRDAEVVGMPFVPTRYFRG
ncbi:glycine cleavage system T protein [Schizopora paradoxa]|uniref:Aminomethyltransferase n=1 Tax=Schizopora paradoxa TaxID=27342 RepID=A0A0H2R621_9AGAM|nr:glycine cleavage system T protein [Schizopora paradoxa]